MYDIIDKKIMEQAQESIVQPSENYDARVNQVLNGLPVTRENVIKMATWQRVAATFAVCLLSISSCVVAANYMVSERLQSMSDKEVAGYSVNEQNTKANADSYSRTLTEAEKERLAELRDAYSMEGEFPISQLRTVVSLDDVEIDRMCYVIADSLFYFPDRELKDEELLQYIDFCTKRDYSIAKTWKESTEAQVEHSLSLNASQMVQKGRDLVQKVFSVDVSGCEYSLELLKENNDDASDGLFVLGFKLDNIVFYRVSADTESGDFNVRIMGEYNYSTEMQVDEDSYKDNYVVIQALLEESFDVQENEIKEALLIYEKTDSNMLVNDVLTYVVQTRDNAGFVMRYSAENRKCIMVDFYREYSSYDDMIENQIVEAEKMNNTLCIVPLEIE